MNILSKYHRVLSNQAITVEQFACSFSNSKEIKKTKQIKTEITKKTDF